MQIFKEELIQFNKKATDWKNAIKIASKPLLKNGYINENFVPNLISETKRLGPYYILAPNLALGHISPDGSCL
ncbi:PTS sugar transporter subunit IIA, partial [Williamsoniiplasma luminosum]